MNAVKDGICGYQEAVQKGAKITINEVINDLRNEIQRYEDAHPKN